MSRYIKEILILSYCFAEYQGFFARLTDLGFSLAGAAYVVLFILIMIGVLAAAYISSTITRVVFAIAIYSSAVSFDIYERITGQLLSYNAFISLLNARDFIGSVLFQHSSHIIIASASGLILLAGIVMRPRAHPTLPGYLPVMTPLTITLLITLMLFSRGGDGAKALPTTFTLLAYSNLVAYEAITNVVGERSKVDMQREHKKIQYDIVYIVDESIAPNYLDINVKHGVTTSLKTNYRDFTIFNYGYAASITNCSYATNITLRYGGTRQDYIRINSTMPSIWEYAKRAGLQTVYMDAQNEGKKLQNGMDQSELTFIDHFVQFDDVSVMNRDITAAKKLAEYLNNDTREFILVNKTGAHFPVHDKYPDDFLLYKPVLKRGQFLNINYTGSREGFSGSDDAWVQYRNSYKNTLSWNVGEFFSILFKSADMTNAVVLYTSDHGQDLNERGNSWHNTHCGDDPNIEEGIVPLVVMNGRSVDALNWHKYYSKNINQTSHYNIFPTLLSLMSYDRKHIKKLYGNSLDEITEDPFTFNTLFNARLGRKPVWKQINVDDIVEPLTMDPTSVMMTDKPEDEI